MTQEITFSSPIFDLIDQPTPSLLKIPKTYKDMPNFNGSSKFFESTVKKCIPFLDALTIGYIITIPVDYVVQISEEIKNDKKETKFDLKYSDEIPDTFNEFMGISSHFSYQVPKELRNEHRTVNAILKFSNPWTIKTPPGYSCIFTQPFNRNLPYKIIDGVVDTDQYTLPINFPFYWTQDLSIKECLIPKGTPMALVIPFKRDNWKMKIEKQEHEDKFKSKIKFGAYFIDKYKRLFWKKKSFK